MAPGPVTTADVPDAFDEVADRNDLMVGLSPGYHEQLRSSADALVLSRGKTWPDWVRFAQGRAEDLASQPELAEGRTEGGLDGVLAACLVRNVPDRDAVIAAIHDELRPGGVLVVHDYSVRGRPVATVVWTVVCWAVIVPLGWLTSRRTRPVPGWQRGIVHTVVGRRPAR